MKEIHYVLNWKGKLYDLHLHCNYGYGIYSCKLFNQAVNLSLYGDRDRRNAARITIRGGKSPYLHFWWKIVIKKQHLRRIGETLGMYEHQKVNNKLHK